MVGGVQYVSKEEKHNIFFNVILNIFADHWYVQVHIVYM